ncbi:MAG: trigger factor [Actinobacteria bacterium]|nr:trigger factor [Actinomycetota bacterium]
MKANWERIGKCAAQFEIEVDQDTVEKAMDRAYRKVVQKVNIPGFRRGKAPRFVVERFVGREALFQEAAETIIPEAYNEAVKESGLEPVDQPQVDFKEYEKGQPLIFKADVQVKPEVDLGTYKGLEVEEEVPVVSEEDVDRQIEFLRERAAEMVAVEDGALENGLFAVIDFEGSVDGTPFTGGSGQDYLLEIGSGTFVPGFEDQLIGAKPGEEREVNVTFPEDYRNKDLAGKAAQFQVSVKEVKRKVLPALDDEFARSVSQFQTLQELRADLSNRLREAAEAKARRSNENRIVEMVTAAANTELPEALVDRRIHRMIEDLEMQLRRQGLTLESYQQATGKSHESLHEDFRESAEKSVKTDLVLDAIAKKEGLEASEEEVDAEIEKMAKGYGDQSEAMKKYLSSSDNRDRLREAVRLDKAVKFLAENQKLIPELEKKDE